MPVTADELLALATRLDEDALEALRSGDKDGAASAAEAARQHASRLTASAGGRIVRTMNVDTRGRPAAVKRGAGRATRQHPAQKKLYEAGVTITDVARELRETRARVSSWMAEDEAGKSDKPKANRPIPRHHAVYLRDRYGVPLGVWKRISG